VCTGHPATRSSSTASWRGRPRASFYTRQPLWLYAAATLVVDDAVDKETDIERPSWPKTCSPYRVEITLYNSAMIITRKIRKVGNSLMIPLPPETIFESGFKAGMEVAIGSRPGHVDLDPADIPDTWVVEFTARFTERYREDLAELAEL
jgi:hypothetical protein